MKHFFFLNPAAGQGKGIDKLDKKIRQVAEQAGIDYSVYTTWSPMDAEKKAREFAKDMNGEPVRFYVAGGDGTASEVMNGLVGIPNVEVGIIPIGTGNDFVRNFPEAGDFHSIEAQLLGKSKPVDLIKYGGKIDGKKRKRYCINMFNIGFDCNVVNMAGKLKEKPFIAGSGAYLMAVFGTFIKKEGISLIVKNGDEVVKEGKMLLCSIANGGYCGGGIYSSPRSSVDDGYFELNILNNLSRATFLRMFNSYRTGKYLDHRLAPVLTVSRQHLTSLRVEPYKSKEFVMCVDGEIFHTEGIDLSIEPQTINFIVPAKQ